MADEITALWQEAEQHLRAFEQLARRTVQEAWLAGDALLRIKDQLPHGGWRTGLEERGISKSTAHRFITLRKRYPEMSQVGTFRSVQAALTDSKKARETERAVPAKEKINPTYVISCDDLWDWERAEPTALARRLLTEEELQEFTTEVVREMQLLVNLFESDALLSAGVHMMRRRLSCHVNIGPLKDDPGAITETKRRLSIFSGSVDQLIEGAKTSHDDATIDHVAQD